MVCVRAVSASQQLACVAHAPAVQGVCAYKQQLSTKGLVVPLQVFNECKPNGVISPETCEYYQRWLEF